MSDKNSQNVDKSKQTLRHNAGNILSVIAIALSAFFGWQYFQKNRTTSVDMVAADKFSNVQQIGQSMTALKQSIAEETAESKAMIESQTKAFDAEIESLIANHGDTVYAWQGLMLKARQQMDSNDFVAASDTLKQALAIDLKDAGLKAITQLRYAQSLLAAGNADEALAVAKQEMPSSFEGSQQELLGDIYQGQGDKEQAKRAYENAWQSLSKRQENRAVLALKMESLGIEAEAITVESVVEQPKPKVEASLPEGVEIVDVLPETASTESQTTEASEEVSTQSNADSTQTAEGEAPASQSDESSE